jgi:hypothetical protein
MGQRAAAIEIVFLVLNSLQRLVRTGGAIFLARDPIREDWRISSPRCIQYSDDVLGIATVVPSYSYQSYCTYIDGLVKLCKTT